MPNHSVRLGCDKCGDTGTVLLDQKVAEDAVVQWAYRCDCPLGAKYPKLALAPQAAF